MLKNSPFYKPRWEKLEVASHHHQLSLQPGGDPGSPVHPRLPSFAAYRWQGSGDLEEAALVAAGLEALSSSVLVAVCGSTRIWGRQWDLGGLSGGAILNTF